MPAPQGKQLGAAIIECLDVHKWFGTFTPCAVVA